MQEVIRNNPKSTWPLASYRPPETRREGPVERREDPLRAASGERRARDRRSLRALLRL